MEAFFIYLLKSTACLTAFAVLFRLLLMKETFFRFTRIALIFGLMTCSVLPFIELKMGKPQVFKQTVFRLDEALVASKQIFPQTPFIETNAPREQMAAENTTSVVNAQKPSISVSWFDILVLVYWLGFGAMIVRFSASIVRLWLLISKCRIAKFDGYKLVISPENVVPFSFLRYIVLSEKDYRENPDEIIAHEKMHILKKHNIDVIFSELFLALHWFNPMVWLLCRDLREIHEYEADNAVIETGIEAQKYQLLLVKKAVGERRFTSVVNSFNQSKIKNRITMMLKKESSAWARLKVLFVVPLAAVALFAFAQPENLKEKFVERMERKNAADFFRSIQEVQQENYLAYLYLNTQNKLFVMRENSDDASINVVDLNDKTDLVKVFDEALSHAIGGKQPNSAQFILGAENDTQMRNVTEVKNAMREAYDNRCVKVSNENNVSLESVTRQFPLTITYTTVQTANLPDFAQQVCENPFFYWEQVQNYCKEHGIEPKDLKKEIAEKNRNLVVVLINSVNQVMLTNNWGSEWAKSQADGLSDKTTQSLKKMMVETIDKNRDKPLFVSLQNDMVSSTDFIFRFINQVLPTAYDEALKEISDKENVSYDALKKEKPMLLLYSIPRSFGIKNNVQSNRLNKAGGAFQVRVTTQKGDMEEMGVLSGIRLREGNGIETASLKWEPLLDNSEKLKAQNIFIRESGFYDPVDKALVALDEKMDEKDAQGIKKMLEKEDRLAVKETCFVFSLTNW